MYRCALGGEHSSLLSRPAIAKTQNNKTFLHLLTRSYGANPSLQLQTTKCDSSSLNSREIYTCGHRTEYTGTKIAAVTRQQAILNQANPLFFSSCSVNPCFIHEFASRFHEAITNILTPHKNQRNVSDATVHASLFF